MIADRTKAALLVKKAQGVRLGNRTNLAEAQGMGAAAGKAAADAFAANVMPVVRELQAAGIKTGRAIAEALNARGILELELELTRFRGHPHAFAGGVSHAQEPRSLCA